MRKGILLTAVMMISFCSITNAAPLPLHSVEGTSGVLITSTAYLANAPEEGEVFGTPSVSVTGIFGSHKDIQSFVVTENILGKIELGYSYERFGLGDWASDVKKGTGAKVDNHLGLHNFNVRTVLIDEGSYDCSWMPAVTFGTHFKWSDGQTKLDQDLNGLLDTLGSDHSSGIEFTAVASKTITDLLPKPIILTAGLRNGDAIHTGLFGFAGERKTTFEGSVIAFITDRLAFAAEYRQKSDLMDQVSAGGEDLVKAENDWWTLLLVYVIDDNTTISGGYMSLGNLANHREDALGIQVKYEF